MKFSVLTPALLAALAASASAVEYSSDSDSCTNLYNKIVCETKDVEADCNAVTACEWSADDSECNLKAAAKTVFEADEGKAQTAVYDCGADALATETACNADDNCVWGGQEGCVNEAITAVALLINDSAPKGTQAYFAIEGIQAEKCLSAANEAACTNVECEWNTMTIDGQTQSRCEMNMLYKATNGKTYCTTEGGDWDALATSSGHKSAGAIAVTFAALASAFALM